MRILTALLAVAALAVASRAYADAAPSSGVDATPRRAPLDYGRPAPPPNHARAAALWVPRLLLSPLYLTTEYLLRAPLSVSLTAAERADLPRKAIDFFLFGPDRKAGILPVAYIDVGFSPSAGLYGFWHDAFAEGNDLSLHTEAWPSDWYALSVEESLRLDASKTLQFHFAGVHRPDRVFYGIGPETLQSSQSRYTEALTDEDVTLDWKYFRGSHLAMTAGVKSESLGPGYHGNDPSVEREAMAGAFPLPYGLGGRYTAQTNRIEATFDSRRPAPAPGTGVRLDARVEQGSNMLGSPASGWLRYGGGAAGFLDLDGHGHVLSLAASAMFADPLGSEPIPFTELVSLGGDSPMRGYLPRRLIGRSAVVASASYAWPIAPGVGGTLEAALGNVFDEHLEGFQPDLLRFAGDVGITTVGLTESPIALTVGVGSETFAQGGQLDSVRVALSFNRGF